MADRYRLGSRVPAGSDMDPAGVAAARCEGLSAPERAQFMEAFQYGLVAEHDGIDAWLVLDGMYRKDRSAAIAGYLEGLAAARRHDVIVKRS